MYTHFYSSRIFLEPFKNFAFVHSINLVWLLLFFSPSSSLFFLYYYYYYNFWGRSKFCGLKLIQFGRASLWKILHIHKYRNRVPENSVAFISMEFWSIYSVSPQIHACLLLLTITYKSSVLLLFANHCAKGPMYSISFDTSKNSIRLSSSH